MKLITLNAWGGRICEPLIDFIKKHQDVDIFCMQEIYHEAFERDEYWHHEINSNLFNDLKKVFPNHNCFFDSHLEDWWGLAIFVNKKFPIIEHGDKFVHLQKGYNVDLEKQGYTAKNIQYITIMLNNKKLTVINLHGLWNNKGKGDFEERITQSKNIINFAKKLKNDFIICGDFNLLPETKSLKLIEQELGLRNLISEYGITSTRTSYYKKEHKFADYVFITPGIIVKDFKVLPDEVSDHNPVYFEFE